METVGPPAAAVTASAVGAGQGAVPVLVDGERPVGPIESAALGVVVAVDRMDNAIYGVLDAAAKWLSGLPVTPVTEFLQGSLLLVRRTFFDQAPTLHPKQLTGQLEGPITGTLDTVDPEGEPITYTVVDAPTGGTVTINPDGTYTYTRGPGFDGSDGFIVAASDQKAKSTAVLGAPGATKAFNGNILEPRRPSSTEAFVEVDQGTAARITFDFTKYKDDKARVAWEAHPDALPTLQKAAFYLAKAVNPERPVTLTYRLGLISDSLASAGSDQVNDEAKGFYMTVVQSKIIKGSSTATPEFDGRVNFNFYPTYEKVAGGPDFPAAWNYANEVKPAEYNFQNVATHELLHSFGFNDNVKKPGCNYVECSKGVPTEDPKINWFYYDKFTGNKKGDVAINRETYRWDPEFDTNLIADVDKKYSPDGLYFTGDNAKKAFGGKPVPLLSKGPEYSNSSVSHLNDYYFKDPDLTKTEGLKLMNAFDEPGVKVPVTLSAIEIGMLKDLGYRMK